MFCILFLMTFIFLLLAFPQMKKRQNLNFVWGDLPVPGGRFHVFPKVQSLGVCVAALCIWLQPLDVGSVWTARGEVGKGSTVDMLLTSSNYRNLTIFKHRSSKKNANNLNKQISGG